MTRRKRRKFPSTTTENGDIYGKMIEVQLLEFDRGEQKFASLEELKERIEKDKEFALRYFAENPLYNPVKI